MILCFALPHFTLAQTRLVPIVSTSATPSTSQKLEDGNSYFHTDLFGKMSEPEHNAYNQAFITMMESGEPNKTTSWQSGRFSGSMVLEDTFTDSAQMPCHHYRETYQTTKIRQIFRGMGCQQGPRNWCKLRPDSVPTCNMKAPEGLEGMISDAKQGMQNLKQNWWPF